MGSDTSNYPHWWCRHQWILINTQDSGVRQPMEWRYCQPMPMRTLQEPSCTWLSSSHWEQTMHVCVQWFHWVSWYQCQCWHCPILVTVSYLAWHCVTILHHGHRHNKPKVMLSFPPPHWSPSLNSSLWLVPWPQPWLVICIILASLACDDWARPGQYTVIMNIHRPKNGLPVMSDFWDIQISNVIIMTPGTSRQRHYVSSH